MELYDYVVAEGVVVPKTSEILADIQQKWLNIFPSMILDSSTPQGRVIELLAQIRKEELGLVALLANQINPQYATGERLDAIAGLFYIKRRGESYTTVNAVLTGKPLTYSTAEIVWSDAGVDSGDAITINNSVSFIFGTDIAIGATLTETSNNVVEAINGNSSLNQIMEASAISGGTGVKIASTKLASLADDNFYRIYISYAASASATTPKSISSTKGDTFIEAGSIASDSSNNLYSLSESVLLDSNGTGNGVFVCKTGGKIPCPQDTLTTIVSSVDGWETVNNPSAGTIGAEREGDESLYRRYNLSKAKYSMGYVSSLLAALYDIEGVKSAWIYENDTNLPKTNSSDSTIPVGETVDPHSVFIVVDGGNASGEFDNQVAEAIMKKKSAGCGMTAANENLSTHATAHRITISPEIGGGTFTAVYNTPASIPIFISMQVSLGNYTGSDIQEDIKNTLVEWGAGNLNNEEGLTIGKSVSPFNISCVVQRTLGIYVKDCKIGTSFNNLGYNEIPIEITQKAVLIDSNMIINA